MTSMSDTLRAVADLLDTHPGLPQPCIWGYGSTGNVEVQWQLMHADGVDDQKAAAQLIVRAIGGTWDKDPSDELFRFTQKVDGLSLEVLVHRDQVCERVVVGTEEVTLPAVEAQPERTETREKVEWRCEPLLAEVPA